MKIGFIKQILFYCLIYSTYRLKRQACKTEEQEGLASPKKIPKIQIENTIALEFSCIAISNALFSIKTLRHFNSKIKDTFKFIASKNEFYKSLSMENNEQLSNLIGRLEELNNKLKGFKQRIKDNFSILRHCKKQPLPIDSDNKLKITSDNSRPELVIPDSEQLEELFNGLKEIYGFLLNSLIPRFDDFINNSFSLHKYLKKEIGYIIQFFDTNANIKNQFENGTLSSMLNLFQEQAMKYIIELRVFTNIIFRLSLIDIIFYSRSYFYLFSEEYKGFYKKMRDSYNKLTSELGDISNLNDFNQILISNSIAVFNDWREKLIEFQNLFCFFESTFIELFNANKSYIEEYFDAFRSYNDKSKQSPNKFE